MTDPFSVPSSERGTVRVFTTDLEPEGNAAITAENVHKLLGDSLDLDPTRIEVFPSKAIEPIGLAAYLSEGYGIPEEDLKGTAAALDSLTGLIVLIASGAFKGAVVQLEPKPALRFVGLFSEPQPTPPTTMSAPEAAEGVIGPSGDASLPDAGRRGSTWPLALAALLIAAGLVLFLVL